MKLLMISGDRSILAGKQGAFWYTLEELSKHFDRIDVITPRAEGPLIGSRSHPFPNVIFHPSSAGLWGQPLWIFKKGTELIAAHHHEVMTVHDYPPFYNGIGAMRLARRTSIPFALEIHHVVGHPNPASIAEQFGFWMSRVMIPLEAAQAAAVRCVSAPTAALLESWKVQRISVVPSMYLDHAALTPDPGIHKNYDVVCCARLVPNKGIDRMIEALTLMPNATLLVIGDGPERGSLEERARQRHVADRVMFAGWMNDAHEVYRTMQSAKVCVMASLSEGGPRVALEAMALGMPLVATNVGLMPDVIDHGRNGLITTGTPVDIAEKVTMLLESDMMRAGIGKEARRILDRFERGKTAKAYAEFLKMTAAQPQ